MTRDPIAQVVAEMLELVSTWPEVTTLAGLHELNAQLSRRIASIDVLVDADWLHDVRSAWSPLDTRTAIVADQERELLSDVERTEVVAVRERLRAILAGG